MWREVDEFGDAMTYNRQTIEMTLGQGGHAQFERQIWDHRHEVGVAGAFAVTVDGSLHLRGPTNNRGNRVGNSATRVVLRVNTNTSRATHKRHDLRDDVLNLVRKGTAVGIAQHHAVGAIHHGRFKNSQREFRVRFVPIEKVFGVEKYSQAFGLKERNRFGHHRNAFVQRRAQRFGDVEIPALSHNAHC